MTKNTLPNRKKKTMNAEAPKARLEPKQHRERPQFGESLVQLLQPTLRSLRENPRMAKYSEGMERTIRVFGDIFLSHPRPSGNESEIVGALVENATQRGWMSEVDTHNNLCMVIPATQGHENDRVIMTHFHTDMVPAQGKNAKTDPKVDPIEPTVVQIDGKQWLQAKDDTTFGADDGAGAAAILQAVQDMTQERDSENNLIAHGPVLILATSREETGLEGMRELVENNTFDPNGIVAQLLPRVGYVLNSDGEKADRLTVGALGGDRMTIDLPVEYEAIPDGYESVTIRLDGFRGGHSGVNAANPSAISSLAQLLDCLDCSQVRVVSLGTRNEAANALAEDAYITLAAPKEQHEQLLQAAIQNGKSLQQKYTDDLFTVSFEIASTSFTEAMSEDSSQKAFSLLSGLAKLQGVASSSEIFGDSLLERSMNIGTVGIQDNTLSFMGYTRVRFPQEYNGYDTQLEEITAATGAKCIPGQHIPIWQFNPSFMDNYTHLQDVYEQAFGEKYFLEFAPGGTEMSWFDQIYPHVFKFANGATIIDAHKAGERVLAESLATLYAKNRKVLEVWRDMILQENTQVPSRRSQTP